MARDDSKGYIFWDSLLLGELTPKFWSTFNEWNNQYWKAINWTLLGATLGYGFVNHIFSPRVSLMLLFLVVCALLAFISVRLAERREQGHELVSCSYALVTFGYSLCQWELTGILRLPSFLLLLLGYCGMRIHYMVVNVVLMILIVLTLVVSSHGTVLNPVTAQDSVLLSADTMLVFLSMVLGNMHSRSVMQVQQRLFEHINDRILIYPRDGRIELSPDVTPRAKAACTANAEHQLTFRDPELEQAYQSEKEERLRRPSLWFDRMRGWLVFALVYLAVVYGLAYVQAMLVILSPTQTVELSPLGVVCVSSKAGATVAALVIALVTIWWEGYPYLCMKTAVFVTVWNGVNVRICADRADSVAPNPATPTLLATDFFAFAILTAHSVLHHSPRSAITWDLAILAIYNVALCVALVVLDGRLGPFFDQRDAVGYVVCSNAYMLLVAACCFAQELTLEKCSRQQWLFESDGRSDHERERRAGGEPQLGDFSAEPPDVDSEEDTVDIRVVSATRELGPIFFYSIEVTFKFARADRPPQRHIVVRSAQRLRVDLVALYDAQLCASLPYIDDSFDQLDSAYEWLVQHHRERLEQILRRFVPLRTHAAASSLFGIADRVGPKVDAIPALQVLILTVGSRGDVQPFLSMAKELQAAGHRCRICTHAQFEAFVRGEGLEFYPMAGEEGDWTPAKLMRFMEEQRSMALRDLVRLTPWDIAERQNVTKTIFLPTQPPGYDDAFNPYYGSWAAAFQPDLRTGRPFRAEALISNPPAYTHIHIAERLHIPCHLVFTMPWSQTRSVGHPLHPTGSSRGGRYERYWNEIGFRWVSQIQWTGLQGYQNEFRRVLGLEALDSVDHGPVLVDALKVPFAYCFSPHLLPKPDDWGPHIDITGFFFRWSKQHRLPAAGRPGRFPRCRAAAALCRLRINLFRPLADLHRGPAGGEGSRPPCDHSHGLVRA
jgi:hypothetical protein